MNYKQFQRKILTWYRKNGRHTLPWRKTRNPYRICVSELMLQQTQVDRVIPKYRAFLKKFPTPAALAKASVAEVLQEWQGLGYNRRALFLKKTATVLTQSGSWPRDPASLQTLPGIGHYTARAIATFAYNSPEIFLETNIRRVFIHFFFPNTDNPIDDREILPLIAATLPKNNPREWYWALMDYGSGPLKKISNPNRKSQHYTRQSRFEGSHRQIRGKILQLLLDKKTMSMKTMQDKLTLPAERLTPALDELTREGFLTKKGSKYTLSLLSQYDF